MQLSATVADAMGTMSPAYLASTPSWHIHQADALTLPWEEPCVDLFLANPPYLAAKNIDLSGYRSTHQRGQIDSYLLFLSLGLQIVRPGGWLGLVLPDPLLARTNAANERARLLKKFSIHHLWHLAGVFTAHVGAVVIIAQKCPPKSRHQVAWKREQWKLTPTRTTTRVPSHLSTFTGKLLGQIPKPVGAGEDEVEGGDACVAREVERRSGRWATPPYRTSPAPTVSQSLFQRQPRAELRYLLSTEQNSIIERLQTYLNEIPATSSRFAPLDRFLSISRGEELGGKSSNLIQQEKLFPNERSLPGHSRGDPLWSPSMGLSPNMWSSSSSYTDGDSEKQKWYPVLRGGKDACPYVTPHADWFIAREATTKPLERYLSLKLLVVKSTDRLQATLDLGGHVALQTLYLLHLREQNMPEDDLYFFLALLNSRLLRNYVYVLHTAYKWVQPQIEQHVLSRLPVPIATIEEKKGVIERAKLLVRACSAQGPVVEWKLDIQDIYEEQERAIYALYDTTIC